MCVCIYHIEVFLSGGGWDDHPFRLVGILVEAVQTVATMEHEQIRVDLAKTVA